MQVKLFWVNSPWEDSGFVIEHSGGNARAGEAEINDWLARNPNIDIKHIKQSVCGYASLISGVSAWVVSVWYTSRAEPSIG